MRRAVLVLLVAFVVTLILGGISGWRCSINRFSTPGWETHIAFMVVCVLGFGLVLLHRNHKRQLWFWWLMPELFALWAGFVVGYEAAQLLFDAEFRQQMLGHAVMWPLMMFIPVMLALSLLQRRRTLS